MDSTEGVTDRFDSTTDLLDNLFENIDTALDQLGKKDKKSDYTRIMKMIKPQDNWKDEIDNSNTPFLPKLKEKPNAQESLEKSLLRNGNEQSFIKFGYGSGSGGLVTRESSPHPYYFELKNLKFNSSLYEFRKEQKYLGLKNVNCSWIDKVEDLKKMVEKLQKEKEISIDIEQHSYRTFQGFTCLIQISTRKEDFLIDPFELKKELTILNHVFTNPNIVKVMHGSENDVLWLQRDFSVYIVNLFDTGQAARMMDFPSFSFAYLLKKYCDIEPDKKYQTADWRIRPLPSEMAVYARQDTHYLLYIYDKMVNELGPKVQLVLEKSKEICLTRYEKPLLQDNSYIGFLNNVKMNLTLQQEQILKSIYEWRDEVARKEDESTQYILPNHHLLIIAQTVPKNIQHMLRIIYPVSSFLMRDKELVFKMISSKEEVYSVQTEKKKEETENFIQYSTSFGWKENLKENPLEISSDEEEDEEKKKKIEIQSINYSNLFDDFQEDIKDEKIQQLYESFSFGTPMFNIDTTQFKEEKKPEKKPEKKVEKAPEEEEKEPEEEGIKSINDIYSISKKNKGVKNKKLLKQEAIQDSSPAFDNDSEGLTKPIDFMKKLGWITPDEKELKKFKQANPFSFNVNLPKKKK